MNKDLQDKIDLEARVIKTDKLTGIEKEEHNVKAMKWLQEECDNKGYSLVEYVTYYFNKCNELS